MRPVLIQVSTTIVRVASVITKVKPPVLLVLRLRLLILLLLQLPQRGVRVLRDAQRGLELLALHPGQLEVRGMPGLVLRDQIHAAVGRGRGLLAVRSNRAQLLAAIRAAADRLPLQLVRLARVGEFEGRLHKSKGKRRNEKSGTGQGKQPERSYRCQIGVDARLGLEPAARIVRFALRLHAGDGRKPVEVGRQGEARRGRDGSERRNSEKWKLK